MTAPSNANTSGLEVVAWRFRSRDGFGGWSFERSDPSYLDPSGYVIQPLLTAASAQAAIDAEKARADRLAKALERQADNMAFLLNHAPIVQHWYEKFSTELADDRAALQQEIQP